MQQKWRDPNSQAPRIPGRSECVVSCPLLPSPASVFLAPHVPLTHGLCPPATLSFSQSLNGPCSFSPTVLGKQRGLFGEAPFLSPHPLVALYPSHKPQCGCQFLWEALLGARSLR